MRLIDADKLHYTRVLIPQKDGTVSGMLHAAVLGSEIKDAPTVDAQEVKHGKWIVQHRHIRYPSGKSYDVDVDVCLFCGRKDHNGDGLYCGYCGAIIDLE